ASARGVPSAGGARYLRVAPHGGTPRSAERAHAALFEGGGRCLRRALPTDGSAPVPVLLAPDAGEVGGRRSPSGDHAPTASSARHLPGGVQCAALDLRDLTRGPCRPTAVLAPAPRRSRVGERRRRARPASGHRPPVAGIRGPCSRPSS